jgi:hypothetical protein
VKRATTGLVLWANRGNNRAESRGARKCLPLLPSGVKAML